MNWYIQVVKKYAVFTGRARRKEFWLFFLFNSIVLYALFLLDCIFGTFIKVRLGVSCPIVTSIYFLAMVLPALGVSVRRLHDIGKTGWWVLIIAMPLAYSILAFITENTPSFYYDMNFLEFPLFYVILIALVLGFIIFTIFSIIKGKKGANLYGSDPKEIIAEGEKD